MRIPLAPIFCAAAGCLAGYTAFHPVWRKPPQVSGGSATGFRQAAEVIVSGDLMDKAAPQERVAWLLEICRQPDGAERDYALYEAIQKMQPADFISAFTQLEMLGERMYGMSKETREALATAGMDRWMDVDPAGAKRILAATAAVFKSGASKLPHLDERELLPMVQVLARRDPEWTKQMIGNLDEHTGRNAAVVSLLSETMRRNPKQAREWYNSYLGTPDEKAAKKGYLDGLVKTDPQAALANSLLEKDEKVRSNLVLGCFDTLAHENPGAIPGLLPQLDPKQQRDVIRRTIESVLADPAVDAFSYLSQSLEGAREFEAPYMVYNCLDTLLQRDPAKTMDWVRGLSMDEQPRIMDSALQRWSKADPAGLLDWLAAQPPEKLPAGYAIGGLAAADPAKFEAWTASLPPGAFRDGARLDVANQQLAQGDLAAAMAAFPQDLKNAGARGAAQGFSEDLAREDLAATVNWVKTLPPGASQAAAAAGLITTWMDTNPQEAANWVQGLPSSGMRDSAAAAIAQSVKKADPTAAAEWIAQIGDAEVRGHAAASLMAEWQTKDPAPARAWLEALSGVPDSMKNYCLHHAP